MSVYKDYPRTGNLLRRKYISYLLPTTLTMAALSLNEFVDSLIVSRLLGADAMAVVNLGMPVMLVMACFYTFLGNGGATLFARALGERNREYAGTCFRTAMLSAAVIGVLLLLTGMVFCTPMSHFLCREPVLQPAFQKYLRAAILSAPLIMTILTFLEFLPPSGIPAYATAINIIANGVNLVMDVVYIRFFHMGVEGAAYATFTGYAVGLLPILWIIVTHKIQIPHGRWFEGKAFQNIVVTGGPSALVQLGFTLKFGYSNAMAAMLGGAAGVVAFSLCIQSISIVSIFLMGATAAATPFIATLHGQRDYFGESAILRYTMRITVVSMLVSTVIFEIFPRQMATVYNITAPEQLALSEHALRIFVISFVFRGISMVIMRYMQADGNRRFSMFISLFDGCIGIIPVSWLCIRLLGLDGVRAAYPITAVILLVIVAAHNLFVSKHSKGLLTGLLLTRKEDPAIKVQSWTIPEEQPSWLSEALTEFLQASGISGRVSEHAGLVAEEMVLYTLKHTRRADYMDVIARQYPDRVEIDFRSLGDPVNPLLPLDESAGDGAINDQTLNLKLLREMADKLDYEYIMGMNCTHAEIDAKA